MKKIQYIDYECNVGDRVYWINIAGKRFEGIIVSWNIDTCVATVKLDDDTEVEVQC